MKNIRGKKIICKRCEETFSIESYKQKPKCQECGKELKNARDTITKKISKYLWESDCECEGMKNFRLSIG